MGKRLLFQVNLVAIKTNTQNERLILKEKRAQCGRNGQRGSVVFTQHRQKSE